MPVKCLECGGDSTDDITPVNCFTCKASYHPKCVKVDAEGKVMDCRQCAVSDPPKVPAAPKSDRRKALSIKSRSSRSSKTSRSIQNELKLLNAQRSLEIKAQEQLQAERDKHLAEKEKLIKEKLETEMKYLREKTLLEQELEENDDSDGQGSLTSEQEARKKVEDWNLNNDKKPIGQDVRDDKSDKAGGSQVAADIRKVTHALGRTSINDNEHGEEKFQDPRGSSTFNHGRTINRPSTSSHFIPKNTLTKEHLAARNSEMKNLPAFSGISKEWPVFIQQFEQSTMLCGFNDLDNIVRLRNCLKGNAKRVVEGALSYPENVSHIINTLRQLFGRPEFILNELM